MCMVGFGLKIWIRRLNCNALYGWEGPDDEELLPPSLLSPYLFFTIDPVVEFVWTNSTTGLTSVLNLLI